MNRPPAFQFYAKDFLSDENVIAMSMENRGIYITMLAMCWIQDGISSDLEIVSSWMKSSSLIARCFYEKDGKLRNHRLDEERRKQLLWKEKCSKGGLKSVETRRLRKGSSRVVQLKVNNHPTLQSSSSSSNVYKECIVAIMEKWNKLADEFNLPKIDDIRGNRLGHLKARMAEKSFDFDKIIGIIKQSPLLIGQVPGKDGAPPFRVAFDWLIKDGNWIKVKEGNYLGPHKETPEELMARSQRELHRGEK